MSLQDRELDGLIRLEKDAEWKTDGPSCAQWMAAAKSRRVRVMRRGRIMAGACLLMLAAVAASLMYEQHARGRQRDLEVYRNMAETLEYRPAEGLAGMDGIFGDRGSEDPLAAFVADSALQN